MRHVNNVMAQEKISAQNAKIIWKNQMDQMADNAYVALLYEIMYALQAVKMGNM